MSLLCFFLVLPLYCYPPISLHPHAHMLSHVIPWNSACQTPVHGLFQARILEWVAISFSISLFLSSFQFLKASLISSERKIFTNKTIYGFNYSFINISTCWNSVICQDWVFRYKQERNGHFSHWFCNKRDKYEPKQSPKEIRRINQKISKRIPHVGIGKKYRITRVDQPGWPGRPLSRKSDLRKDRWETPSHVKKKQKSVLSRENVICKGCEGPVPNKSLACCEMEGQGVWEGVASDDARGGGVARNSSHWFTFWGKWDPMEEFKRGRDMIWISFAC